MRASLLVIVCLLPLTTAQNIPPGFGREAADDYSLGPVGAQALPLTKDEVKALGLPGKKKGAALRVTSVLESGPAAEAGLLPDDIIFGTGAGLFTHKEDPILQLTAAVESAETGRTARLGLLVHRDGAPTRVSLQLVPRGKHLRGCPRSCTRCEQLYQESLQALTELQLPDGSFPMQTGGSGGKVVVTSLAGLALLASGSTPTSGPYQAHIARALRFVHRTVGQDTSWKNLDTGANWNQENWELSYAPLFLCECYQHQPSRQLRVKLEELATRLVANMEATGGWAHGPGGPNALDYLELEIVSNYAMAALGCIRSVGIEVPQEALDRARDYVLRCTTGDGGVAYSHRPGQVGMGEAGRTAGAFLAFARCGMQARPEHQKMGKYLQRNLRQLPTGHVSPVMHFLAGAMACWELGPRAWSTYWETFRTTFRSYRQPDGLFCAVPTEETQALRSNTDRGCGPGWTTASYALLQGIPRGNLPVLLPGKEPPEPPDLESLPEGDLDEDQGITPGTPPAATGTSTDPDDPPGEGGETER